MILAIYQYFVLATQHEVLTRKLEQDIIRYKQFCTCTKNFVRTYLNKHQEKKKRLLKLIKASLFGGIGFLPFLCAEYS